MDDTKREELEKACKKIRKVRIRMAAVRMFGWKGLASNWIGIWPIGGKVRNLQGIGTVCFLTGLHASYPKRMRPTGKAWGG